MIRKSLPPAVEWDFRAFPEDTLLESALWERARSNPDVHKAGAAWLDSNDNGAPVRERLKAVETGSRAYWQHLRSAVEAVRSPELAELIVTVRHDFPAPWAAMRVEVVPTPPEASRVIVEPMADAFTANLRRWRKVAERGGDGNAFIRSTQGGKYRLSIDWENSTVDEIAEDFTRWLRKEAQKRQDLKKRGKPGQAPIEPLKRLAAYRLAEAGLSFPQVQAAMDCVIERSPVNLKLAEQAGVNVKSIPKPSGQVRHGGRSVLPIFYDKSGFSRAVATARREVELAGDFDSEGRKLLAFLESCFLNAPY